MRRAVKPLHVWTVALVFYSCIRLVVGYPGEPAEVIVSILLFVTGLYWFIVPYVTRQPMEVPAYAAFRLERGKDDAARLILFIVGMFMYITSIGL